MATGTNSLRGEADRFAPALQSMTATDPSSHGPSRANERDLRDVFAIYSRRPFVVITLLSGARYVPETLQCSRQPV